MSKVIGIDLGSTNSCVAIVENGKATVIVNEDGGRTTPSVIGLKGGERKIGNAAKRQQIVNPKETVILIKRFMGSTYKEATEAIHHIQYEVINSNNFPKVKIENKEYSPEELSSMILSKLKQIAEDYLGESITDAVITVPAYFNDQQRSATKTAGELAGLNVLRVIAEPTAALLASNIDMNKGGKYMVVDYGGATLDFSVADISDSVVEILASQGDVYCGGSDIDKAVADYIISEFKKDTSIDLSKDAQAYARVYEAAEKAKCELSTSASSDVSLPYITVKDNIPQHLNMSITKAKFEQLISDNIDHVIDCGKEALNKAGVKASELNGILLVGGSCRIPLVQEKLTKEFGVELIKNLNLDEAVALGASIQGSILSGETDSDILLLDVVPISYGIETMGSIMTKIVEANTTIPCKKTQIFSTAVDNQSAVTIRVLQGERPMANDNKEIGIFNLDGIIPAMRGVPQIEVEFNIDANGILSVTATDKGTNKEQHITIETKGALSQEEIERIKADAEAHAEEDKKVKETADTINKGDTIAFQTKKSIEEFGDKLSEDEKSKLNDIVERMGKAVTDRDCDLINSIEKELTEIWQPIAQRLYSQPNTEESVKSADDNVADAEFEEVK